MTTGIAQKREAANEAREAKAADEEARSEALERLKQDEAQVFEAGPVAYFEPWLTLKYYPSYVAGSLRTHWYYPKASPPQADLTFQIKGSKDPKSILPNGVTATHELLCRWDGHAWSIQKDIEVSTDPPGD